MTFDALIKSKLYAYVQGCAFSTDLCIRLLQMSDAFYNTPFLSNYATLLHENVRI